MYWNESPRVRPQEGREKALPTLRSAPARRLLHTLLLITVFCIQGVVCFLAGPGRRAHGLTSASSRRLTRPKAVWVDACSSLSARRVRVSPAPSPIAPLAPSPSLKLDGALGGEGPSPRHHVPQLQRAKRPQTFQAKLNRELVAHEDDPEAILEMVRTHAPDMNAVNCATALHRLSRVGPSAANGLTSDPRFVLLLSRTEETLPYSNPQALSNILHALSHLHHHPGSAFLSLLLRHALQQLHAFTPQALCLTLTSLASLRHSPSPAFLSRFYPAVLTRLHNFTPQGLSTLLHSLSTLPLPSSPPASFLHPTTSHFLSTLLPSASPTSLSLFTASLACFPPPPSPAAPALLLAALPLLPTFSPQDSVLLLQGLSKLRPPADLLLPLLTHVETSLPSFPPISLPLLLLSLTRLRVPLPPSLLTSLSSSLETHASSLSPNGLVTCLYSLYCLHARRPLSPRLLSLSLPHLQHHASTLDHHDASHMLLLLASSSSPTQPADTAPWSLFLPALLSGLAPRLSHASGLDLATMLSSLAKLRHNPGPAFLSHFTSACLGKLRHMAPSSLAKVLYGLARLHATQAMADGPFAKELYEGLMQASTKALFSGQDIAHMTLSLGRLQASVPPPVLDMLLLQAAQGAKAQRLNRRDVAAVVQGLGMLGARRVGGPRGHLACLNAIDAQVAALAESLTLWEAVGVVRGYAAMFTGMGEVEGDWKTQLEGVRRLLASLVAKIDAGRARLGSTVDLSEVYRALRVLRFEEEALRIGALHSGAPKETRR